MVTWHVFFLVHWFFWNGMEWDNHFTIHGYKLYLSSPVYCYEMWWIKDMGIFEFSNQPNLLVTRVQQLACHNQILWVGFQSWNVLSLECCMPLGVSLHLAPLYPKLSPWPTKLANELGHHLACRWCPTPYSHHIRPVQDTLLLLCGKSAHVRVPLVIRSNAVRCPLGRIETRLYEARTLTSVQLGSYDLRCPSCWVG